MILTETWFYDCAALDNLMCDASSGEGIRFLNFCRKRKGRQNIGGGVSIAFKADRVKASEFKMKRSGHEIVAARIKLTNNTRPMFVLAVYASTRLNATKARELLTLVNDAIHKIKSTNGNPYILIAGDFNNWPEERAFEDFDDIITIQTPPTRGSATLDITATSFNHHLVKASVLPPLRNDESETDSDHRVILYEFSLSHRHEFEKISFWRRNMRRREECIKEINERQWRLPPINSPDEYVSAFHRELVGIIDEFLPLQKITKKSTDVPWFNAGIKKKMKQRRAVYRREGRSRNWRELKNICRDMLERSKQRYYDRTAAQLTSKNNVAYAAIRALKDIDAPSSWQPSQLRPTSTPQQLGEEMADFYAKISQEFSPLKTDQIPRTYDRAKISLDEERVQKELKNFKLPKSYVTYRVGP